MNTNSDGLPCLFRQALSLCAPEFLDRFEHAGVILSKEQGNFERSAGEVAPLFFLLRMKCPEAAAELRTDIGTIVLRSRSRVPERGERRRLAVKGCNAGRGIHR